MPDSSYSVLHNHEKKRFEVHIESKIALSEYMEQSSLIVFSHTEVPEGLEGKGIASSLAKAGLLYARQQNKKVMPLCPYVAGYIRRHPQYLEMVMKGFKI